MSELPITNKIQRTDDDRRKHPYCQECKLACENAGKDWNKTTENCKGVYSEADFIEISEATGMDIETVRIMFNPSEWLKENVGLAPHWYQDRAIRCTSSKKTLRWGRRTGKTHIVAAWLFYMAITHEGIKILCVTPMKNHALEIFGRVQEFIEGDERLRGETKSRQQPAYEIKFKNHSRIRIIPAGTGSGPTAGRQVRGQEADILYLDEMDYFDEDAFQAIMPILSDPQRHGEPIRFIASSTPSGKEGMFFKLCHDSSYREFFVPSRWRPDWNEQMEMNARYQAKTQTQYEHEYEAEWGTKADGVFRRNDIISCLQEYRYHLEDGDADTKKWPQMKRWPHWTYMMGVDWNGAGTGTRIVVTGFDPTKERWIVVYREIVSQEDFALHTAIERIVELNRYWRCHSIYIDAGFGQMQDEYLREIGRQANAAKAKGEDYHDADTRLEKHVKTVDFGSWIEFDVKDPDTGKIEKKKKRIKNYMVENAQRHFELRSIWMSKSDHELKQELMGYYVDREDNHGYSIYKGDKEVGDHDLDALILSLYAFNREFDPDFRKKYTSELRVAQRPEGKLSEQGVEDRPDPWEQPAAYSKWQDQQKKLKRDRRHGAVESRDIDYKNEEKVVPVGEGFAVYSYKKTNTRNYGARGLNKQIPSRNQWRNSGSGRRLPGGKRKI